MANVLVVDPGELGELLATLLVQYGMSAERARTGEEALERALQNPPEVVIVEQHLPDAPGIDVAELLRSELAAKAILIYPQQLVAEPDDALLARVAKLDGSFLRPFRSLTLVEYVADLLEVLLPGASAGTSQGPLSSTEGGLLGDDASEELLLDVTVDEAQEPATADVDPERAAEPVARPLAAKIAERAFKPGSLTGLWEKLKARRAQPPTQPVLSSEGVLSPRALADALDAFHQSQTTGEIWLQNGRARRVLFLRRGVIAGARSNIEGEELIALALKQGLVTPDAVLAVRDALKGGVHKNVLDAVLALGLLSEPDLRRLVYEHTRLVALRAFLWKAGSLRVSFEGRATREPVTTQVPVGDVIVRGILMTEDTEGLEQAAPDDARFTPASDAGHGLNDLTLSALEARIVIAMDGTKTIKDLCLLFDDVDAGLVRGLAAGLLCIGLVRFAGWGHASARQISYF